MARKKSRFSFPAAFILISVLGLYFMNLIIDNKITHRFISFYINEKVIGNIPIHVSYESMKVQLLPPAVKLYSVKIKDGQESDAYEIVNADQVSLTVSGMSLLLAKPKIGQLELHDLEVKWPLSPKLSEYLQQRKMDDGKKDKSEKILWPPSFELPVSKIKIFNSTFDLKFVGLDLTPKQDAEETTGLTLQKTNVDISIDGWQSINVGIDSNDASLWDSGRSFLEHSKVKTSFGLRGNRIFSDTLEVSDSRIASSGNFSGELKKKGRFLEKIEFEVNSNFFAQATLFASFLDMDNSQGDLSGKVGVSLGFDLAENQKVDYRVKVDATSRGAVFAGFQLLDSSAQLVIDSKKVEFTNVDVKSGDKSFGKGKGSISFSEGIPFDFRLGLNKIPLGVLLGIFNVPFGLLQLNLSSESVRLEGKSEPFDMKVTALAKLDEISFKEPPRPDSAFPYSPQCTVSLGLQIGSKGIDYSGKNGQCGMQSPGVATDTSSLNFSGKTTFDDRIGMDLSFTSDKFDLSLLSSFTQLPLSGKGSIKTRIYGPYSGVKVENIFRFGEFKLGEAGYSAIEGRALVEDDKVKVTNVDLRGPQNTKATLEEFIFGLDSTEKISLKAQLKDFDPTLVKATFAAIFGKQFDLGFGINNAKISIDTAAKTFLKGLGELDFSIRDLVYDNVNYLSAASGALVFDKQSVFSKNLRINQGDFSAVTEIKLTHGADVRAQGVLGTLGLSSNSQVQIVSSFREQIADQDQIGRLPFIGELAQKVGIKGRLSGQSKLVGNLSELSGVSKVKVSQFRVFNIAAPELLLEIISQGLKLDVFGEQGGNALKARFSVDLASKSLPYSWFFSAKNVDLRPVIGNVFSNDPRNFAYFTGSSKMSGSLSDWFASTGYFDVKGFNGRFYPVMSGELAPMTWRLKEGHKVNVEKNLWTIEGGRKLELFSDFGNLDIGMQNFSLPANMGLTLDGIVNLESARRLVPGLEVATGQLKVSGSVTGPLEKIAPDIRITSVEGPLTKNLQADRFVSLGTAEIRPPLKNIQLAARISNEGVYIDRFISDKGSGKVSASGFVKLFQASNEGLESDLTVELNEASFVYPFPVVKNFDSTLNGSIRLTGSSLPYLASGKVEIKRARTTRDVDLREAILDGIRSSETIRSSRDVAPFLEFDIAIVGQESISFNTRLVQATLSAQLELTGTNVQPKVLGFIETKKGRFYHKRDFEIQRCLISFDDPIKLDPSLDITASSEVDGYKVSILLSGRSSDPKMDFAVDPPNRADGSVISTVDVLVLLSRGSLPDRTVGSNTTAETTATAEAINLLAGQVEDTVQRFFDMSGQNIIRQVYIDTYAGESGIPIARFNLPVNLFKDLDLVLKVDQNTVNLSSQYNLQDSISVSGGVESSTDRQGVEVRRSRGPADVGGDLRFRFAFP